MPYTVFRGDNKTLRVSITDSCGDPVDTTGWTIDFTLRTQNNNPTPLVVKNSGVAGEIDAVDEEGGVWDIFLLPADTDQSIASYVFDVQATSADATPKIYTVVKDTLTIEQDVTY